MDPATPLETLCRIILRAREYEAQTVDYADDEDADDVDDEQEGTLSVLEDVDDLVEDLAASLSKL